MIASSSPAPLGVVVVTFNSTDVILDCLESLLASSGGVALRIAVVDNASTDGTIALIRDWAAGTRAYEKPDDVPFALAASTKPRALDGQVDTETGHAITLVETGINAGFAAGVNAGLAHLAKDPEIERFWVLNPDCVVPSGTAAAFAHAPEPDGGFGLMGGRVLYCDGSNSIQIDGGTINWRTGVTGNLNKGAAADVPAPRIEDMDFITGASMVASRRFYEQAGPMPEDYFLYYEEVDWALQRGKLPFAYCPEGVVYHRAGTSIGSASPGRLASPFSQYFKYRARMRFVRRHRPSALPMAFAYTLAKAGQMVLQGYPKDAWTIIGASLGLGPARSIRERLSKEALHKAFGQ